MECHIASLMRFSNKLWSSSKLDMEGVHNARYNVGFGNTISGSPSLTLMHRVLGDRCIRRHLPGRMHAISFNLESGPSSSSSPKYLIDGDGIASDGIMPKSLGIEELKLLQADSERSKLINKLSEANQHNRYLQRQLKIKEDALVSFQSEIAVLDYEIQALANLAVEVVRSGIPAGSRQINGNFIQSVLLDRLRALHVKLEEQMEDIDPVLSKEIPLFWCGMAENVQVMGSFDGWSRGEDLSPEYTGSFIKFSTTLVLRPGRYEIKFKVDGEWHLSPELPTIGEGMMQNNLLVVE